MAEKNQGLKHLLGYVAKYIRSVIKKISYRRKMRQEVKDTLWDCKTVEEIEECAKRLTAKFGDMNVLAKLIRRSKKRCWRPLWKRVFIRMGQVILIVYVLACICNAWVTYTWSADQVDYVEMFNQLNRPAARGEENALVFYEKAIKLYVGVPEELEEAFSSWESGKFAVRFESLSEANKTKLQQWLQQNEASWEQVVKATKVEHYWWNVSSIEPVGEVISKHISLFEKLAKIGTWRARQKAIDQEFKEAMATCLTTIKMTKHLMGSKLALEYMFGAAMVRQTEETILEIIASYSLERDYLANVKEELENLFLEGYPIFDLQGEAIVFLADFRKARGVITKNPLSWIIPVQLFWGSRQAFERTTQQFFEEIDYETPFDRRQNKKVKKNKLFSPLRIVLEGLKPTVVESMTDISYRHKAIHEAVLAVLAIKRWRLEKGEYPEKLESLVEEVYLKELPMDPYSDGHLVYKRIGNNFTLYSLGADFDDDGGVHSDDWGKGKKDGDYVFWPV